MKNVWNFLEKYPRTRFPGSRLFACVDSNCYCFCMKYDTVNAIADVSNMIVLFLTGIQHDIVIPKVSNMILLSLLYQNRYFYCKCIKYDTVISDMYST